MADTNGDGRRDAGHAYRRALEACAQHRQAASRHWTQLLSGMRHDATSGGTAAMPVSGGTPPDPAGDLAAAGGPRPDPDHLAAIRWIARRQNELHERWRDKFGHLVDPQTPQDPCQCCGRDTAHIEGVCGWCHRFRRRRGRPCTEEDHARRGTEVTTVDRDKLCSCRDTRHQHPPGGCTRRHGGNRNQMCDNCRTCRCDGRCRRDACQGDCQGRQRHNATKCDACDKALQRASQ